jgi:hypothetical protein
MDWMRRESAAVVAVTIAVAISLVAGLSSIVVLRSTGFGNRARLAVLGRTAVARAEVPGVRLLHESRRQANWPEDEGQFDQNSIYRFYRVERDLPAAIAYLDRVIAADGWSVVQATCQPRGNRIGDVDNLRRYGLRSRDARGRYRSLLSVSWTISGSYLDPSRHSVNLAISVAAPSVRGPQDIARYKPESIDRTCLNRPAPVPNLAPPAGIGCSPVDALLASSQPPAAAVPLSGTPLPPGAALFSPPGRRTTTTIDGQGWERPKSHLSEPPELLGRHGMVEALHSDLRDAEVHAFRFSSHDDARTFQADAVRRVCERAIELFNVPGVPGAVAFRQFVPATGDRCHHEPDLLYNLGSSLRSTGCSNTDFVFDYVSFVRGQFAFDVVVGTADSGEWGENNDFLQVDLSARRANVVGAAKNLEDRAAAMAK